MGRLYDAFVEVGPRFTGFGDIKREGDKAGQAYGKALGEAAAKAAQANVRKLGEALSKARTAEADAAGKVRVAEAKLAEVRATSNAKTSQIAAAEEALASAQRKSATAANTAKEATQALDKARDQVSKTAGTAGAESGGRFSKAFRGSLSKIGGDREGKMFATRFGVGMNGAIGGIVSKSAGIFAAGFAAVQGAQLFTGFIKDAADSARVSRLTAAAIKSTGGAAKITTAQVGDLATAISNKTGADDETIQSGSNLLLTFTKIRNEVGKGNDIFNQASATVTDMAAALNNGEVTTNGVKSASIQLGKALNDPIKGVTALSKVGVSFTADQKKQIKTLVESGKTMEAQKIILGELKTEFGGAAAAAGDPFTRLKTVFGNLGEELGGHLLPAAERFAGFVTDKVIPAISGLANLIVKGDFTKGLREAFNIEEDSGFVTFILNTRDLLRSFFTEVRGGLTAFGAAWKANDGDITSSGFPGFMEKLAFAAHQAFDYFKSDVLPVLKDLGKWIRDDVLPALTRFGGYLAEVVFPIVKRVVVEGFQGFKDGLANVRQAFEDNKPQLETFVSKVGEIVSWIGDKLGPILGWLAGTQMKFVYSQIANVITGIGKFVDAIGWVTRTAQDMGVKIAAVWSAMGTAISSSWEAVKSASRDALRYVVNKVLEFGQQIIDGAAAAFSWVPGIGDKLKSAKVAFQKFRDSVNTSLSGIDDEPVDIKVSLAYTKALGQNPLMKNNFATGGPVFGAGTATSDSIPAMLSNNEHVWTAKEVQAAGGHKAVELMRKRVVSGFANGGVVLKTGLPSARRIQGIANSAAGDVDDIGTSLANSIAKKLAAQALGPGGPPGARKAFRGVTLNSRTIGMLLNAERLLGRMFHITQGSYSTSVAASGGTHAGGGAMDTDGPGGWAAAVSALRKVGFAAWHRTPAQGPWGHHIHSIALGDSSASPAAKAQMASYRRGGDGLGHGMARGGKVLLRDMGGPLPHGSMALNLSGKTETVVPGGGTMTVNLSAEDRRLLRDMRAKVYLDSRELSDGLTRRAFREGY